MIVELATDPDEYLRYCGVIGLGRLLVEALDGAEQGDAWPRRASGLSAELLEHAASDRWRVREAVAMALQRVGDRHPWALLEIVASWALHPHPLVQRAAVAAVCEPRLLTDRSAARAALTACATATLALTARPRTERADTDVRVLRKALGYCWSVAVAADPEHGLPLFVRLETEHPQDPDVTWIVKENRKKARLQRLLTQEPRPPQ